VIEGGGLKLISADNSHGPVVDREVRIMIPVIKVVVHYDYRPVVPAKRAPTDIVIMPPPVDPCRPPVMMRNPVPAESEPPVPAAVMINGPSPGLRRNPGPSDHRVPDPAAVKVWPPVERTHIRHPYVTIRILVNPTAVVLQFFLIFIKGRRQVASGTPLGIQGFPRFIPILESIRARIAVFRVSEKPSFRDGKYFPSMENDRAAFPGGFEFALDDVGRGSAFGHDVEAVQANIQDIKRAIGSVNFGGLVTSQVLYLKVDISFKQMKSYRFVGLLGQSDKFHLAVLIEAEKVAAAEMDLGPALLGPQLVSLDDNQVDLSFLVTEISESLDEDVADHVVQPGVTVRIIILVFLFLTDD